ncbi:MAG: hypothetical protein LWX83_08210 [Anaerolineae bacterium]|nr:hypothetical protein [Anaerolineae bacterium]
MNKSTTSKLSRRVFLKWTALSGLSAAGIYLLDTYTPWLNYDQETLESLKMIPTHTDAAVNFKEWVYYAGLAASSHNTQPWMFEIKQDEINIYPDHTRRLSVLDPQGRELWISLGCALENLLISARAAGYDGEVIYPVKTDVINIRFASRASQNEALLDAIPRRQNTRCEYKLNPVPPDHLHLLRAISLEPGINLHFALDAHERTILTECVSAADVYQYADQTFISELNAWLRFTRKEAIHSRDGLYTRCSGNPEVPRWLGELFVSGTKPQQQADLDIRKMDHSAGLIIITSETDDKSAWVRTGQVYERLALSMTSMGIKSSMLNQPIEVPEVRAQMQNALAMETRLPQLLLRFGYAEDLPRSLRRNINQILVTPAPATI